MLRTTAEGAAPHRRRNPVELCLENLMISLNFLARNRRPDEGEEGKLAAKRVGAEDDASG